MNIFPSNPAQKDSGDPKPSSLGPKFMMLVILTLVIGGLMWNFFQQGNDKPAGGSSILDGTPFDIPNPYSQEFEPVEGADDPFSSGGEVAPVEQLEPFVEKPEVLAAAAARDRTGNVERFGTIHEEGVVYLAHKIRSDLVAGKTPEEPVMSTAKRAQVFASLLEKPDLYRGKLVEVRANIIREEKGRNVLQLAALPSDSNPLDTNRLYRSYIYDENEMMHLVYTLRDQSADLGHMEQVRLRGYFCRLYTAEVDYGGQTRKGTIPLLVASEYEKLASGATAGAGDISALKLTIGLVLSICLISGTVILLVNRRSQATYAARLQAAREKGAPVEVTRDEAGEETEEPPEDGSEEDEAQGDAEDPGDEASGEGEESAEDDSKD